MYNNIVKVQFNCGKHTFPLMSIHSEMHPKDLTQTDIEKIVHFDWRNSADEENDEEELEGAASFEIITDVILQNVIDDGENNLVMAYENSNDKDVIQTAMEKLLYKV